MNAGGGGQYGYQRNEYSVVICRPLMQKGSIKIGCLQSAESEFQLLMMMMGFLCGERRCSEVSLLGENQIKFTEEAERNGMSLALEIKSTSSLEIGTILLTKKEHLTSEYIYCVCFHAFSLLSLKYLSLQTYLFMNTYIHFNIY